MEFSLGLPAAPAVRSMVAWMAGLDFMFARSSAASVTGNSLKLMTAASCPWVEARVHHQTGLCSLLVSGPAAWVLDLNLGELRHRCYRAPKGAGSTCQHSS